MSLSWQDQNPPEPKKEQPRPVSSLGLFLAWPEQTVHIIVLRTQNVGSDHGRPTKKSILIDCQSQDSHANP